MQPLLRITDYIEEYKSLTYDLYSKTGNIIYTTYYQLDYDATVYDESFVSTYRKFGEYSGRHWNKIHLLPLMFVQQAAVNMSGYEKGVSFNDDTLITGTVDPSVGMIPHIGDVLYFNISNHYSFWEIVNLERSGTLDTPYYKLNLKQTRVEESMLMDSVNKEYIYIEFLKKIYLYELGELYIKLNHRLHLLIDNLNQNKYLHNASCHVENRINYIELEKILAIHDSNKPFANVLLVEDYNVDINDDSIVTLLCLPQLFNYDIDPIYTFKKSYINPRANLYVIYDEYITDTTGTLDIISNIYTTDEETIKNEVIAFKTSLKNVVEFESSLTIPFTKLLIEWSKLLVSSNIDNDYETYISTNFLENVMEYCIISKKLISIANNDVTLP